MKQKNEKGMMNQMMRTKKERNRRWGMRNKGDE
jgi:hypothetical protein